ncbi:hypothetical protein Trydic_g15030 [Trypoxylus dichotomus]
MNLGLVKQVGANIKANPKTFWSFGSRRTTPRIPEHMLHNDEQLTQPKDIVNSFAHHVSSEFSVSTLVSQTINTNCPLLVYSLLLRMRR